MQESTAAKSFEIGEGSTSTSPEGGGGRGDRRHTRARPRPPSGTSGRARGELRQGRKSAAGVGRPWTGEAESYPWPSSSMAARKKMTCGSLMS
jgi:hypothetical protein